MINANETQELTLAIYKGDPSDPASPYHWQWVRDQNLIHVLWALVLVVAVVSPIVVDKVKKAWRGWKRGR